MSEKSYTFAVTVTGCTPEQALQVMGERIHHDEDYGFDYRIDFDENQTVRTVNGICLDAESVREEMRERAFVYPGDYSDEQAKAVLEAKDEDISYLIGTSVDDAFWQEYDEVRSQVINRLIDKIS